MAWQETRQALHDAGEEGFGEQSNAEGQQSNAQEDDEVEDPAEEEDFASEARPRPQMMVQSPVTPHCTQGNLQGYHNPQPRGSVWDLPEDQELVTISKSSSSKANPLTRFGFKKKE